MRTVTSLCLLVVLLAPCAATAQESATPTAPPPAVVQAPPTPPPPPPPPPAPPKDKSGSEETIYSLRQNPEIKPPRSIHSPLPAYTPEAKEAKVEGVVTLQAVILKDGKVTDVKVLQGLGYGLDTAAVQTLRDKWRFQPATLDNQPVNVRATIEVTFRLH